MDDSELQTFLETVQRNSKKSLKGIAARFDVATNECPEDFKPLFEHLRQSGTGIAKLETMLPIIREAVADNNSFDLFMHKLKQCLGEGTVHKIVEFYKAKAAAEPAKKEDGKKDKDKGNKEEKGT